MAKSNPESIVVPSTSVEKLFATLSAMPRITHCRKCGYELLHVDATFFTLSGQSLTLPVPFCSKCNRVEELARHAA
jgi:ribosomal protein S27AE